VRSLTLAALAAVAVLSLVALAAEEFLLFRFSIELWHLLKHRH
jgi:hypothetical protein